MRHVHLRESLSWELAGAPSRQIDRVLGRDVAEDLEDLSGIARSVAPQIAKAAPGALKGAATGFAMGGPVGALAGGIAGGIAGSGAIPGANRNGRTPASSNQGQPATSVANPAALQLLLTLLRPEVVEALIAMVVGRHGSRGVEIAGQAVPVAAVTNLIQSLAEAASAAHHTMGGRRGVPRYLSDARRRGEDISASEVRTAALLELVHDAWDDDIAEADHSIDDELDVEDLYPGELAS